MQECHVTLSLHISTPALSQNPTLTFKQPTIVSRVFRFPKMTDAATPVRAPSVSTSGTADNGQYTMLEGYLTDPEHTLDDIRIHLNDERFTDADARKLLGSIRKSVLDVIWQHRNLEIWISRCTRMGCEYAQAVAEEAGVEVGPSRHWFYRQQDLHLKMRGGTRYEVVEMILQHVRVYREAVQGVERLQSTKEDMLGGERME